MPSPQSTQYRSSFYSTTTTAQRLSLPLGTGETVLPYHYVYRCKYCLAGQQRLVATSPPTHTMGILISLPHHCAQACKSLPMDNDILLLLPPFKSPPTNVLLLLPFKSPVANNNTSSLPPLTLSTSDIVLLPCHHTHMLGTSHHHITIYTDANHPRSNNNVSLPCYHLHVR